MEVNKITDNLNFEMLEERVAFIKENNGIFAGKNCDGDEVIVQCQQGEGMIVKTRHSSKPNWYEVVEYDSDGFQDSVTYERA